MASTDSRHDERRRFSRVTFHRPAELHVHGDGTATCELLDIALRGALLEVPSTFRPPLGQRCTLTVWLDAGESIIRMEGEIVHREGTLVGVRCREIDLDSIAHLRRLLELNVGDDAVVERELSSLVSSR